MGADAVEFAVEMKPVGKARPRMTRNGHAYTPAKTVMAEAIIRDAAIAAGAIFGGMPLSVMVTAEFAPPRSWSKKRRAAAIGKPYVGLPDGDNVLKLICDSLTGVAYADDRTVSDMAVVKRYAVEDRLTICIADATATRTRVAR